MDSRLLVSLMMIVTNRAAQREMYSQIVVAIVSLMTMISIDNSDDRVSVMMIYCDSSDDDDDDDDDDTMMMIVMIVSLMMIVMTVSLMMIYDDNSDNDNSDNDTSDTVMRVAKDSIVRRVLAALPLLPPLPLPLLLAR